uniref:DNA-protecting protein DprA n=1 Tax=candidate division CPR3 bacterium TaxID=2268181 RepID=A0A7C5YYI6_UNCC3
MLNLTNEKWGTIQILSCEGVGEATLNLIFKKFGSVLKALSSNPREFLKIGIKPKIAYGIFESAKKFNKSKYENLLFRGVVPVFKDDSFYPERLKRIPRPPSVLWCVGNVNLLLSCPQICVVGTRHNTQYGLEQTQRFVQFFCSRKVTIVSGLAAGIDTIAHNTAISCHGNTVGVVGYGIERYFSDRNNKLFQEVSKNGLIISPFDPFVRPSIKTFPQRNRIMAGISNAVLVVEAGEKSGALITARFAYKYGIPVYAIPGDVNSWRSVGCNNLIKEQKAEIATYPQDLCRCKDLSAVLENSAEECTLSEDEKRILEFLKDKVCSINDIRSKTGLSTPSVLKTLSNLELKGIIVNNSGLYSICRSL